jgi:hypothetical protein
MPDLSQSIRERHLFLFYILDDLGQYYSANIVDGEWDIAVSVPKTPLRYSPANLGGMKIEMQTNKTYFSLNRSVTYPWKFIKDGAAILRYLDYSGLGYNAEAYLQCDEYNPETGDYELYYKGKLDFSKKKDEPKTAEYTINSLDISAWGILSQNDTVPYKVQCNASNRKAIKVIFDGISLKGTFVWQPVANTVFEISAFSGYYTAPIVNILNDGDSAGVVTQGQDIFYDGGSWNTLDENEPNVFMYRTKYASHVDISGTIKYTLSQHTSATEVHIHWYFFRSSDTVGAPGSLPSDRLLHVLDLPSGSTANVIDSFAFTQSFDLEAEEMIKLIMVIDIPDTGSSVKTRLRFDLSNITFTTITKAEPSIAYAVRPLDLAQSIVLQATKNKFTINSNFFVENNKTVVTCGNAIRGDKNAYISSTYQDWFKSYDYRYYLAMRIIAEQLWVEPSGDVYDSDNVLFDAGEVEDVSLDTAVEWLANQIEIGGKDQDYRHSNGRYEFNLLKKFSIDTEVIKNTLSVMPSYRIDGYGIEFLRLDYQAGSSVDNSGDSENFMVTIKDTKGTANVFLDNFLLLTVNSNPFAPIITSPDNNDVIYSLRPIIRGIAPAGRTVNIYRDSIFDGSVVADTNNEWSYVLANDLLPYSQTLLGEVIDSGVHKIEASFGDLTLETTSVTINIATGTTTTEILSPDDSDWLYDNIPLIYGLGQPGDVLALVLDAISAFVTVDASGKWKYQVAVPLGNGSHTLTVNGLTHTFNVDNTVAVPIPISFEDKNLHNGFPVMTGLPTITGTATPGATVNLYLDYYAGVPLGTVTADSNSNWSFTVVPVLKLDTTPLAPIPDGEHVISTDIKILDTPVKISGYLLQRQFAGETIKGTLDDTVMNIQLSPKRALIARGSLWASMMYQKNSSLIRFLTGFKNNSVQTQIGLEGSIIDEDGNNVISSLFEDALFIPNIIKCKAKMPRTFNEIFRNFNQGGVIRLTYQGNEIFALPIGSLSVDDVTNDVQEMTLLISTRTLLSSLQNLFKNGLTINVMDKQIFHSDLNTLHFITYDFQQAEKYNNKEVYNEFFERRTGRYATHPIYSQKWSRVDGVIRDQLIANNLGDQTISLDLYKCGSLLLLASYPYNPVVAPISTPNSIYEAVADISLLPVGLYYFVVSVGGQKLAISERIDFRESYPKTILFECSNSFNKTDFFYTTGIKSVLRIEGLIQTWQPNIDFITNEDEIGDAQLLHGVSTRKRRILIGDGRGIPDYLALKVANFVAELDNLTIDGVSYAPLKDNKLEENDRILGHPLYRYYVDVEPVTNVKGLMVTPVITDLMNVFWAWKDTSFITSELADYPYQHSRNVNPGISSLLIDYTDSGVREYLALKYPKSLGIKFTCWQNNTTFNYGQIPDQVFDEYEDDTYYYAFTRVRPSLDAGNRNILFFVCAAVPPLCIHVTIGSTILPDAVAGEPYNVLLPVIGTTPISISGIVKPSWMSNPFVVGNVIHVTGSPTESDVATGVALSFSLSNCAGSGSGEVSTTVNVVEPPPLTSDLFISYNRFSSSFTVGLSNPLDASFNITLLFADGFATSPCTGTAVASAQFNAVGSSWVISAGWTGDGRAPDSTTGIWSSANFSTVYNLILNGASHIDGDVITIGSYTVTLHLQNCS